MTDPQPWTDDDAALSALLDGALPAEQAEPLRRRIADEPALARRLEELRQVDGALRRTYAGIADEPLPQRVLDGLQSRGVVASFRPRVSSGTRWFSLRSAVATGAALAAGFIIACLVLQRAEPIVPLGFITKGGSVEEGSALYEVLQTVPSSESRALGESWSATARLTFRDKKGDPCRQVDLTGAGGVLETLACRREGSWRMELIAFGPAGTPMAGGVYRPATGVPPSPLDDAIDALIDGAPLGREEEEELIARAWEVAAD